MISERTRKGDEIYKGNIKNKYKDKTKEIGDTEIKEKEVTGSRLSTDDEFVSKSESRTTTKRRNEP